MLMINNGNKRKSADSEFCWILIIEIMSKYVKIQSPMSYDLA